MEWYIWFGIVLIGILSYLGIGKMLVLLALSIGDVNRPRDKGDRLMSWIILVAWPFFIALISVAFLSAILFVVAFACIVFAVILIIMAIGIMASPFVGIKCLLDIVFKGGLIY